jgi:hypothetical protein
MAHDLSAPQVVYFPRQKVTTRGSERTAYVVGQGPGVNGLKLPAHHSTGDSFLGDAPPRDGSFG